MQFIREKLAVPVSREVEASIAGLLNKDFRPVISGSRQELSHILNLSDASGLVGGDVFVTPQGELLYYLLNEDRSGVVAGAVWKGRRENLVWKDFQARISEITGVSFWEPAPLFSERFSLISEDAEPLLVTDWERNAVKVMHNPGMRRLLQVVAGVPSISLQSASEGRSLSEVGVEAQTMDELGILCREFEVYCRDTQQKVSRVASLAALEEASNRGFKCFHCGRSISEEQVVQSLTVTQEGKRLSLPNMWLAYVVGATIIDRGVPAERIIYRHERDYKTVEVFADINGSIFMFSLQEDGASPDNAFRILTRTSYFSPDYAFLVSSSPISRESLKVFAVNERLSVVDKLANLGASVDRAILKATRGIIRNVLTDFVPNTKISLGDFVAEYFVGPEPKAVEEAVPQQPTVKAAAPPAPVAPKEPVAPKPAQTAVKSAKPETSAPAAVVKPVEKDKKPAAVSPAQAVAPAKVAAKAAPAEEHVGLSAELSAALADNAVLAGDNDIKKRLSLALTKNAYEETDELEDIISKFSGVPGVSAMIAGSDGLPFLGAMETSADSELIAALQSDLIMSVVDTCAEHELGNFSGLSLCGSFGTLYFNPFGEEDLNIIIHRLRPVVTAVEEKEGRPATSKSVLDFRLGKFFETCKEIKALQEFLVLAKNGDVFASKCTHSELPAKEHLEAAAKGLVDNVSSFLTELTDNRLWSLLLRTDKLQAMVMPLGSKGIFVGIMEAQAAPNIVRRVMPCIAAHVSQSMG